MWSKGLLLILSLAIFVKSDPLDILEDGFKITRPFSAKIDENVITFCKLSKGKMLNISLRTNEIHVRKIMLLQTEVGISITLAKSLTKIPK